MLQRRATSIVLVMALAAAVGYLAVRAGHGPDRADRRRPDEPLLDVERPAAAPAVGGEETSEPEPAPDDEAELSEAERKNREAVRLAEAGRTPEAITLLREVHELDPGHELYARNLQAALINQGFAMLDAERFEAAASLLSEALALGDRVEVRRGLGSAYYRLGKVDLARASLERAVEQGDGDGDTYVTLGRIYLEGRDQPRALAMFEQALAVGADPPGLSDTVERLRRDAEAERDFESLATSHFVLKFQGRENVGAGRTVLNALEDAYRRVGARFAYYPLERLEVILYPDETFRAVTDSPHWSGGVYDGRIKLPIGGLERGSERLDRTLRHEYAHAAIVTLTRGRAPVWLNEGLAQVAEDTWDEGRANRLRMGLARGDLFALVDLEGGFTGFDRERASLAYAQAYFASRWLLDHKGAYNVRRLLEALATAEGTDAALRQSLSLSYDELERRLRADLPRELG